MTPGSLRESLGGQLRILSCEEFVHLLGCHDGVISQRLGDHRTQIRQFPLILPEHTKAPIDDFALGSVPSLADGLFDEIFLGRFEGDLHDWPPRFRLK